MDLYRRHSIDCKHRSKGYSYTKCNCIIWVDARPKFRRSLKTRDWSRAIQRLDEIASDAPDGSGQHTLQQALDLYLSDCRSRHLTDRSVAIYRNAIQPLVEFIGKNAHLSHVTSEKLIHYRSQRKGAILTKKNELQTIKSYFWFCVNHGWIVKNPAQYIRPPRGDSPPTMPYTNDEVRSLIEACGKLRGAAGEAVERTQARALALVLLLLYSGLRISDAVSLERSRLGKDGRLLLYQAKTGQPVYTKLPQKCVDALDKIKGEKYFFWSGESKIDSPTTSARRTIATLGKKTGIHAHPHAFRDTFAVNLLINGADIRKVQLLLGHKSVRTTERSYAPYVKQFQAGLDEAVGLLNYG